MKPLIIFDVDGTLVDAAAVDNACFDAAFFEVTGQPLTEELWSTFQEVTAPAIVHQALGKDWPEISSVAAEIRDRFLAKLRAAHFLNSALLRPFSGAIELVSHLRESAGFDVTIATGCWRETAHFKLTSAGFDLADLPFACASDRHNRAEIISLAAERAGSSVAHAIYIGDGLWDLKATRQLGIPFIGVGLKRELLRQAGANYILEELSMKALLKLLDEMKSTRLPSH